MLKQNEMKTALSSAEYIFQMKHGRKIDRCVEENKDVEVRDEENTKSEINTTNNPLCPKSNFVIVSSFFMEHRCLSRA